MEDRMKNIRKSKWASMPREIAKADLLETCRFGSGRVESIRFGSGRIRSYYFKGMTVRAYISLVKRMRRSHLQNLVSGPFWIQIQSQMMVSSVNDGAHEFY